MATGAHTLTPVVVEVALAPQLAPGATGQRGRTVFIVVDVIRATTSICVLLERGCRRLRVAETVAEALRLAEGDPTDAGAPRPLLAGEVGGLPPAGLDVGNSPAAFAQGDYRAADVVFATSNGTRALFACAGGAAILVGALRNAAAVARVAVARATAGACAETAAADQAPWTVMVVCAGAYDRPAMDDTICAGIIAAAVLEELRAGGYTVEVESGAQIALAVREVALARGLAAALADTWAARAVMEIGLAADLPWCAALDASTVVPYVAGADPAHHLLRIEPWAAMGDALAALP